MSEVQLTDADVTEMRKLLDKPKYGSSDRHRDRQRTRLKRLGLIEFNRASWEWRITVAGRIALEEAE